MTNMDQVIAAAKAGSAAIGGDSFSEHDKLVYMGALTVVLDGLEAFIANDDLRRFLGEVIDAERQSVPHMVSCDCPNPVEH